MIGPMLERGLDVAIFGFQVETSLHALSLIIAGVFDRFPKLTLVLGHLGEGLPYWMSRIDHMHGASVGSGRYANWKVLQRRPSDYLRENVYVTTSGMPWAPAIAFAQQVLGVDRVMYAMDYPYQVLRRGSGRQRRHRRIAGRPHPVLPDQRRARFQAGVTTRARGASQRTASHVPATPGSLRAVEPHRPSLSARPSGASTAE